MAAAGQSSSYLASLEAEDGLLEGGVGVLFSFDYSKSLHDMFKQKAHNGESDGQKDEWMDGQAEKRKDGQADEWKDATVNHVISVEDYTELISDGANGEQANECNHPCFV